MKKVFTFLPGHRTDKEKKNSPPEEKGRASAKRREQVRKAQRTHRERKEQYVKSLETEVLRLRSSEMNLQVQADHLYSHIGVLQSILQQNGLEYPVAPYERGDLANPVHLAQGTDFASPPSNANTEANSAAASNGAHGSPALRHENFKNSTSPADAPVESVSIQPAIGHGLGQWENSAERLCDKDLNEVGIEFVLALENPCLPHLEPLPNEGNGHALTATMSLTRLPPPHTHAHQHGYANGFTQASGQAVSTCNPAQDTHQSSVIFENLLELSHEIIFEEEISPIQAWSQLIQQPWVRDLEIRQIKELSELLLQYINCHGFGAVMSRDAFNDSIAHLASRFQHRS